MSEVDTAEAEAVIATHNASLRGLNLRELPLNAFSGFEMVTSLDLSNNELVLIPGIEALVALKTLDLSRNWFRALPHNLVQLQQLETLDLSRNFMRPNSEAMYFDGLKQLSNLKMIDLRYNRKCDRQSLVDRFATELPLVQVKITIAFPAPEGAFVGNAPADRDPLLLRSQLEPWSTLILRRRLVSAFGQEPTDPETVDRAEVMRRLLACYEQEGAERQKVYVDGTPVRKELLDELKEELNDWARKHVRNKQERPSIAAESYMILRSQEEFVGNPQGKRAKQAAVKLQSYQKLWDLAKIAITEVDPEFASKYTAIAVTKGFTGSPHIDKQNIGPFYGLALGDFPSGQGGICVEYDPRTVAVVNTQHRLGKVDGRFPHWVAPYDEGHERYSVIYYQTMGEPSPIASSVFGDVRQSQ